jgi:cytochrome c553
MVEWVRARCAGQSRLHRIQRILAVAGLLVLGIALGSSTLPSALPQDHGSQATNCQACHGPPPDGNEEEGGVDDEGL